MEDLDRMSLVLERLGFRPVIRIVKKRTVYELDGVHFCLDRVAGLSDFVEMEWQGEDLDEGKRRIFGAQEKAGDGEMSGAPIWSCSWKGLITSCGSFRSRSPLSWGGAVSSRTSLTAGCRPEGYSPGTGR